MRTVNSVIRPRTPSDPTSISLILGPTARRESGRTSRSCPSGKTAFNPTTISSIFPYRDEACPAPRHAAQPPTVDIVMDCGRCPAVKPCARRASSNCQPFMPACTVAVESITLIAINLLSRLRSITSSPTRGIVPPRTPDPAPKGIVQIFSARVNFTSC